MPNINSSNYLLKQGIEEVLRDFCKAENSDKNLWQNITGGNNMRKWILDIHDNKAKQVTLKEIIEKALKGK